MATSKISSAPMQPSHPPEGIEAPRFRWKVIVQIGAGFAVVWATSLMLLAMVPQVGKWAVGITGVLTLVALGFGIYIWRLTRKSSAILNILKGATDDAGRAKALEELEGQGDRQDAMNALARAQLVARDKPSEAITILEQVDLKKTPTMVQDDVRANLALLYLMNQRTRDARELAEQIRLDRQPQPKSKALYAAVIAESFARTGKAEEARKLLETFQPSDPAYGEVGPMLLRAQVYTYLATKNRGLIKKAMEQLAAIDPNMLAVFLVKGAHPELAKIARQVLAAFGAMPQQKLRMRMR